MSVGYSFFPTAGYPRGAPAHGTLVADARTKRGPQHRLTLEAEAVAARLKHAQPDGAAAGAAELRAVVERMTEFLGAAHQYTVKWQRVLDRMSAD